MIGITAYGVYIPRARLSKQAMAAANAWFDPSLKALAKGERSICNWDEDSITMAVEATRDCLSALGDKAIDSLYLASTTLPFLDRQNSVLLGEALNLGQRIRSMDVSSSQRAATSALISLLESKIPNNALLATSEHRRSMAGSRSEMLWGDAAATLSVGCTDVIAEYLGAETLSVDFVDHYRGEDASFDYSWEERWIRDEGFLKIVPAAVNKLLESVALSSADINHFILPSDQLRTPAAVAKTLGIDAGTVVDNQIASVGVAGVAQPILMLAKAIEMAAPGDLILLIGFGQGCDALLFRVTAAVANCVPASGVKGALACRREEGNYNKFLSFNNLLQRDIGKRAESDKQTYLSGYNRRKDLLTGFIGGKCRDCDTVQIPRERYCVNPQCNALDSQDDYRFADKTGTVASWTADSLTFDWNPPAYLGMVEFDGGGKLMMDFSEVEAGKIDVGTKLTMHFRIKQFDPQRGFKKYFWKAVPE
jgi:3-hydroxy-3-methylglutaryl CoA synthase